VAFLPIGYTSHLFFAFSFSEHKHPALTTPSLIAVFRKEQLGSVKGQSDTFLFFPANGSSRLIVRESHSNSLTSASPHTDKHHTINNIVINHNQQSSIMSSTHSSSSPLCTQTEVTANWERLRKSCDSCEAAKVKCSQHKPSCHRCLRHRQPCNREKGRHSTGIHIPRSIRGAT
jgi:hypothetical protein